MSSSFSSCSSSSSLRADSTLIGTTDVNLTPIRSVLHPVSKEIVLQVGRSYFLEGKVAAIESETSSDFKVTLEHVNIGDVQNKYSVGDLLTIGRGNANFAVGRVVVQPPRDSSYVSVTLLSGTAEHCPLIRDVKIATDDEIAEYKRRVADEDKKKRLSALELACSNASCEQLAEFAGVIVKMMTERSKASQTIAPADATQKNAIAGTKIIENS